MLQECQGFGWRELPGRQAVCVPSPRPQQECQVPWHELRPKGALVEPPLPPQT